MYKTAPQGFISAGDGYTQRLDQIVQGTPNFDHCVDDSILWDEDIETNFYSVCDFLKKCSSAGCIFNPSKFQFGELEVNFLGFKITSTGLGPTDDFVNVIKSFPAPTTLSEMRSWLGTINQVSYAFATSKQMEPFRALLSSKLPFAWSPELNDAFIESKREIVRQCELGVRKFEPQRPTALATDWSRASVGCWLTQKFCLCDSTIPGCCSVGWQTIHVSSKFNTQAVSDYHPVEGEAYAAAWALEKCKLFTLGNTKLVLAVDHKPLLAILGQDQEMSEVMNPRLTNFKLKSMAFKFRPVYVPGKDHVVPDTMSRRNDSPVHLLEKPGKAPPVSNNVMPEYATTFGPPAWVSDPQIEAIEAIEQTYIASVTATIQEITSSDPAAGHTVITWNKLNKAAADCPEYRALYEAVTNREVDLSKELQPYAKMIQEFTTLENIVMLQNRVVVPLKLRADVLKYLHAGHQGVQAMLARASQTIYWPSYREDVMRTRAQCVACTTFAPSNPPPLPSDCPNLPLYPFQEICTDFMEWNSKTYMVIVDRYSNWLSVFQLPKDDSKNVIKVLRQYFSVFGVAESICSDGASVYTSREMQLFCKTWGIQQKISSAYHPTSNRRAEIAVKSAKRLIRNNIGPAGSLNTNKFAQALLCLRNTPDPITKVSPAQIVFGREVRDIIPRSSYRPAQAWVDMAAARENSFLARHYAQSEKPRPQRKLEELRPGDQVYIQDQNGTTPRKWSKSGKVLESLPFNSYLIKLDGSNHLTKRNRQFIRKFSPFLTPSKNMTESKDSDEVPNKIHHHLNDAPLASAVATMMLDPQAPFTLLLGASHSPEGASTIPGFQPKTQAV